MQSLINSVQTNLGEQSLISGQVAACSQVQATVLATHAQNFTQGIHKWSNSLTNKLKLKNNYNVINYDVNMPCHQCAILGEHN